jgi:hypothetical protein
LRQQPDAEAGSCTDEQSIRPVSNSLSPRGPIYHKTTSFQCTLVRVGLTPYIL